MKTDSEISEIFRTLNDTREAAIEEIMALNPDYPDRIFAEMEYDGNEAPWTTNRKMLNMIGVNPDTANLYDILQALSLWAIYFTGTNHMDDDLLLQRVMVILDEQVRLIPPNQDRCEIIDFSPSANDPKTGIPLKPLNNRDEFLPRFQRHEPSMAIDNLN